MIVELHMILAFAAAWCAEQRRARAVALGLAAIGLFDAVAAGRPHWPDGLGPQLAGPAVVASVALEVYARRGAWVPPLVALASFAALRVLGPQLGREGVGYALAAAHAAALAVGILSAAFRARHVHKLDARISAALSASCAPGAVGAICWALGRSTSPAWWCDLVCLAGIVVLCRPWGFITRSPSPPASSPLP